MILIIAAMAQGSGAGGLSGGLPLRLPDDMRHFRGLAIGHAEVMGRVTWEPIAACSDGMADLEDALSSVATHVHSQSNALESVIDAADNATTAETVADPPSAVTHHQYHAAN